MRKFFMEYIWQLPQNLLGMLYKDCISDDIITRVNCDDTDYECYLTRNGGGVTLGRYIFVNQNYTDLSNVILHEIGHTKQSRILGPLYLIIIGIPSISWAGLRRLIPALKKINYYSLYTESWANKLMGLNKESKLDTK